MTIQQAQQTLRQIAQIAQQLEQEEQINAQELRQQAQNQYNTEMGGQTQQIGERERNAALQLEKIQDLARRCEHEMIE